MMQTREGSRVALVEYVENVRVREEKNSHAVSETKVETTLEGDGV